MRGRIAVFGLSQGRGGCSGGAWLRRPNAPPTGAAGRTTPIPVDVELVLAVDVSYSMDPEEQALQREGYIAALTSHEFLQALRQGTHGKIAVTYVEWAGITDQRIVVPWRLIDGPESGRCASPPRSRARR